MKKLLTVLIALSLVFSGFAAEPVASADMVDFSGSASATWGFDLENGKSGFLNETDISLTLQLLPDDMSKSTEGSGVWGELVLKVDGATKIEADGVAEGSSPMTVFDGVTVDTAKIHINDVYVGIQDGDFDFGGDFYYPNALNYENDDDDATGFVRSPAPEWGYNQGLVLGYAADMFSVEASVRTRIGDDAVNPDSIDSVVVEAFVAAGESHKVSQTASNIAYFWADGTEATVSDGSVTAGATGSTLFKVVYDLEDASYMSNDYALGLYAEAKPIENLRIGVGAAYGIYSEGEAITQNEGNLSLFAGADYVVSLSETTSIVPAITYNLYSDSKEDYYEVDDKMVQGDLIEKGSIITQNEVGFGVAYRWGQSEDSSSLIEDFFGTKVAYNDADEGDDDILPGISVFANFNLLSGETLADYDFNDDGVIDYKNTIIDNGYTGMETNLPILVEFYSGEIAAVPGLKAYGMFHANVAPKAPEAGLLSLVDSDTGAVGDISEGMMDKGLQVALAASYDIPVGDATVTPSIGGLYRYVGLELKKDDLTEDPYDADDVKNGFDYKKTATDFTPVVRVDLAGAIANTTFTAEWNGASYGNKTTKVGDADEVKTYSDDNGEITLKVKIAL